ncbi:hypothetical protein BJ875DRAFT_488342 [Amylocarpus encephaloides]|uniref:Protein kinase domain-containing protein n=1 Tax=Amylocarpus encephaloides TaxID=45428 RepID=A0A9P7Y9Y1_9HELO|nr:hypothetical protein BJ875DRAFT_488342 [Amylocarpus encephaloides]
MLGALGTRLSLSKTQCLLSTKQLRLFTSQSSHRRRALLTPLSSLFPPKTASTLVRRIHFPASDSRRLSPILSHPSWCDDDYEHYDNDEAKYSDNYNLKSPRLLAVTLGQTFHEQRYQVVHKASISGSPSITNYTIWIAKDRLEDRWVALKLHSRSAEIITADPDSVYANLCRADKGGLHICPLLNEFVVDDYYHAQILQLKGIFMYQGGLEDHRVSSYWKTHRRLSHEVVKALAFLHKQGVVHGSGSRVRKILRNIENDKIDRITLEELYDLIYIPAKYRSEDHSSMDAPPYYRVVVANMGGLGYFLERNICLCGLSSAFVAPATIQTLASDMWSLALSIVTHYSTRYPIFYEDGHISRKHAPPKSEVISCIHTSLGVNEDFPELEDMINYPFMVYYDGGDKAGQEVEEIIGEDEEKWMARVKGELAAMLMRVLKLKAEERVSVEDLLTDKWFDSSDDFEFVDE